MRGIHFFQLMIMILSWYSRSPERSLALAAASNDSSYAYTTEKDFIDHVPNFVSRVEIKAGSLGIYSRIWGVTNSQDLKMRISETSFRIFKRGEIFAFSNKGQIYIYISSFARYITLVYRDTHICIYLDNTASGLVLRFAKGLSERLKRLDDMKNIADNFKDDPELAARLMEIRKKVRLAPFFRNQEDVLHETIPVIQSIMQ